MLVNTRNFLRWDDGEEASSIESDLPLGYVLDGSRCDYRPLLAASEAMRFYINVPEGLDWITTEGAQTLDLIKENGTLYDAGIAPLQIHEFAIDGGTAKTFYAEVVIDGSVPAGNYYFRIMDGEEVKLTSNQIKVVESGTAHRNYSSLVKFRHDRYFYGINYASVETFYQQFRLHINEIENQYEGDREIYNEVTTGKQRTFNNNMKQVKKVETYFFDKYAHEAAAVMFEHDELYINLKRYQKKGAYKIDTQQRSKISKGEIDLYVEEFATANRCTD